MNLNLIAAGITFLLKVMAFITLRATKIQKNMVKHAPLQV